MDYRLLWDIYRLRVRAKRMGLPASCVIIEDQTVIYGHEEGRLLILHNSHSPGMGDSTLFLKYKGKEMRIYWLPSVIPFNTVATSYSWLLNT